MRRRSVLLMVCLTFASCGGEDRTAVGADDPTTSSEPTSTSTRPGAVLPVQAMVDGDELMLDRACSGFDGAIVAVARSGLRVMLVREGALALRIGRPPTFAETSGLTVTAEDRATSYAGTIDWQGELTPVVMTVLADTDLAPCAEGSSER